MPGGKPHIQSMQSQRVGNDLTTEQQQKIAGLFFSLPPVPTAGIHAIFHIHITFYFCILVIISPQSSSVTQSCPTLCDPMNRSMPGLPVHHQLPEFTQIMPIESVMPSSHLIICQPLLLLPPIPPSIRAFSMSQLFARGGQNIGVSASASVLPRNTED